MSRASTTISESPSHPFSQRGWLSFLFRHTLQHPLLAVCPANPTYDRIHLTLRLSLTCKDSSYSSNPGYLHMHIRPVSARSGSMSWQLLLAARSLSRNSQSRTRNAFNVSRPTPRSISSFLSISPCIPPSYPSSYRTPLPNSTNASYMPHLDASAGAWHQLRRCSTHTYAILHTPSSLMDVDCHPSHCLPSLNVGVSKIEICDHSNTKMTTPQPTTKVTDETNDLVYTPTDANMNLNARSTVDDSSQNARCPSLEFKMLSNDSASAC